MRLSKDEAWAVLADAHTGILTTLKADGSPISLPMWFVALDARIYIVTPAASKKVARVKRDPRVSFLVESGERWTELVGVHLTGSARVVDDDDTLCARVRAAMDDKYRRVRTDGRRVDDIVFAVVEVVPDDRILTWDNSRLAT